MSRPTPDLDRRRLAREHIEAAASIVILAAVWWLVMSL